MTDPINLSLSADYEPWTIAFFVAKVATDYRPSEKEAISSNKKYILLSICEAGFACSAVLGIIETVFWSFLALIAKPIHAFAPNDKTEEATKIYAQLITNASGSIYFLSYSSAMLVLNFFGSDAIIDQIPRDIEILIEKGLEKSRTFAAYRWFNPSIAINPYLNKKTN